MKLIVFDMDGVIFNHFSFWMELHKKLGTYEQGKKLTEKYLRNNYEKLVEEVVHKLWRGKPAKLYLDLVRESEYNLGVKDVFSELKNIKTAIISSGSKDLALRAQKELGIDFIFANELIIKDNKIDDFKWPIGDGVNEKIDIIKNLCKKLNISLDNVVYIGDHHNDVGVFKIVGMAIAFNCDDENVKKHAKIVIDKKDLREVLKYIK